MSRPSVRWIGMVAFGLLVCGGVSSVCIAQGFDMSEVARFDRVIGDAKAAMLIDPDSARSKAVAAERMAGTLDDPKTRDISVATAQWLQGEAYLRTGKPQEASRLISTALAKVTSIAPHSKLYADILLSRGGAESGQGRVAAALVDYQSAFARYRRLGDDRGQAMALIFIAWLYTEAMDQTTALKYYHQAIETYRTDPSLSVSIYNNRATAFSELGDYQQALREFKIALGLASNFKSAPLTAQVYANIALLYLEMGNLADGEQAIRDGMRLTDDRETSGSRAGIIAISAKLALQRRQIHAPWTHYEGLGRTGAERHQHLDEGYSPDRV